LPFAVGLSRYANRIVRQNLLVALGMIGVLVPAALLGLAGIGPAIVLHEGSTVAVVLNALRLLGYQDPIEQPGRSSGNVEVQNRCAEGAH
jgi:Zn2+/Cd2+-exporting ATPase